MTTLSKAHKSPSGARRALATMALFFAVSTLAEPANGVPDPESRGRQLARQLCDARPAENLTNSGVLKIRTAQGDSVNLPVSVSVTVTPTNWSTLYTTGRGINASTSGSARLEILHTPGQPNAYHLSSGIGGETVVPESAIFSSFAGSDFGIADLGLEFFRWPAQKLLPNPTSLKRGRSFTLLESTNPGPEGYARVLSWIDQETGGILEAEAYDRQGRLLKVFEPKSFKKVNGQWELQEMEIRNAQAGSRTRLEFDLKTP